MNWKLVICGLLMFTLQQATISFGNPNSNPMPMDTENFNSGKSNKKMDLNQITKMCNESFKIQTGKS